MKCHQEISFEKYDRVRVRNTRANSMRERWVPGTVVKVCGPRTYIVKTGHKARYVHRPYAKMAAVSIFFCLHSN